MYTSTIRRTTISDPDIFPSQCLLRLALLLERLIHRIRHLGQLSESPRNIHSSIKLLDLPTHHTFDLAFPRAPRDPRTHQPRLLRRLMVVKQALRRMQYLLLLDLQILLALLHQILKVLRIRLVRPDILRRVDRIEPRAAEGPRNRVPKARAIHVRQDDQLVAPGQAPQRADGVGKGGPGADAGAKGRALGLVGPLEAVLGGEGGVGGSEQRAVGQRGLLALDARLVRDEGAQAGRARGLELVGRRQALEQRRQVRVDAELPVDERAEAVEGQGTEGGEGAVGWHFSRKEIG